MPNADYRVHVSAEVVPYSHTYYRLSIADRAQVDTIFLSELNTLIPLPASQWHNMPFPNTNYDEILTQVNNLLLPAVDPPAGSLLVLPSQQALVIWKPTTIGHTIGFMARLSDLSGGNFTSWELTPVNFSNMVHLARIGFAYQCVPA